MADDPGKGNHGMSGGLLAGAAALATVLAALVGILNQFGVIGNHEARRNAEVSAPAPIVEEPGSVPGSPVPDEGHSGTGSSVSSLALTKRGNPRILTGAWRDAVGGCHFINQVGSKLEVTNYFPETDDVMSHGGGSVDGPRIQLRLRTMHGEFKMSSDGTILSGTMFRSSGPGRSVWKYIGPSCQKSG
ncbi:MAG: hypothetical protein WAM05_06035 [Candidatus Binataceae bacterium]